MGGVRLQTYRTCATRLARSSSSGKARVTAAATAASDCELYYTAEAVLRCRLAEKTQAPVWKEALSVAGSGVK